MNKKILRLAIPNIITNITVPLLGMVDTGIVGHLESELYIGAIALATMIFNFIYWNFAFLRMGTSGFTAQAYGADNKKETVNILLRSLVVGFLISLVIICCQALILRVALNFVGASQQTKLFAGEYFNIYVWAAPAVLGMYAFSGWFIGMQDAKTPMFISIFTNVLNILLSLLFVFVFGMQIKGVALGSLLSQWLAFIISIIVWSYTYRDYKKYLSFKSLYEIKHFAPFFRVNRDIFLRSLAVVLVTTFFTSASAKFGDSVLAINTLLMQLFILFSYLMDGFAYAAEALTGKFIGAEDGKNLKKLIRRLFVWGLGISLLFTVVYGIFTKQILELLTDKRSLIVMAIDYRGWTLLFPVAGFAAFLWDGIYIGMTASREMRNSMFVAVILFFIIYFLMTPIWGNNGLWFAFILYLSMRGLMQTILFKRLKRSITGY